MQRAEWGSLEMKNKRKTCGIGLDSDGLGPFFAFFFFLKKKKKGSAPQSGLWSRHRLGRRVSGRASREGTEEKKKKRRRKEEEKTRIWSMPVMERLKA